MTRDEKLEVIQDLTRKFAEHPNFYVTDTSNLTVAKVNAIRRKCFGEGIYFRVAKNSLIRKALEATGGDFTQLFEVLKGSSTLLFSEKGNVPAKLIKEFRLTGDKPILKGASIDMAFFIGDDQLDALQTLKSKEELVGEIIGLLQSPAKNVVSALQSGGSILAGVLKTLEERQPAE